MTKNELVLQFPWLSPARHIKEKDGSYCLISRRASISPPVTEGGLWDVWIVNTQDMTEGFSIRQFNLLCKKLNIKSPKWTLGDNEAWTEMTRRDLGEFLDKGIRPLHFFKKQSIKGAAKDPALRFMPSTKENTPNT